MVITIDNRDGSVNLAEPLGARPGLSVRLGRLPFGDVSFIGRGPEGRPVTVGIEYKKLPEMLQSYRDKRWAGHQLPGMVRSYEDPWLLIEGECRPNPKDGLLEVAYHGNWMRSRSGIMWREYRAAMLTLQIKAKVKICYTNDLSETVFAIAALYGWWTGKEWEEHRSHLAFDESGPEGLLAKHSLARRWAKELAGVGYEKSAAIAAVFESAHALANGEPADFARADGVGKVMAGRIVDEIRGIK